MELQKILKELQQDQPINSVKITTKDIYDREWVRKTFISILRNIVFEKSGRDLILNDELTVAINLICQYINNEKEFLNNEGFDFKKGIWVYGAFGSGKTMLMLAYRQFRQLFGGEHGNIVGFKTCVEMNEAFTKVNTDTNKPEGLIAIKTFANKQDEKERIFDDLGEEETTVVDYGNRFCVMQHILSERYKGFPNVKTHITTNLTKAQIATDYGGRIDSRAFEMFNFIVLGSKSDSIDFRKL